MEKSELLEEIEKVKQICLTRLISGVKEKTSESEITNLVRQYLACVDKLCSLQSDLITPEINLLWSVLESMPEFSVLVRAPEVKARFVSVVMERLKEKS